MGIQELLLSSEPRDAEPARDLIASLVTSNRGEYILRLGSHPPINATLSGGVDSVTASDGWIGIKCGAADIKACHEKIKLLADEFGVKVSEVYTSGNSHNSRSTLLLRIPP